MSAELAITDQEATDNGDSPSPDNNSNAVETIDPDWRNSHHNVETPQHDHQFQPVRTSNPESHLLGSFLSPAAPSMVLGPGPEMSDFRSPANSHHSSTQNNSTRGLIATRGETPRVVHC